MSSLVLELQQEALDPSVCISDLLRKALVVSKKLGISEIEEWMSKELNGYVEGDVPEYRWAYGRVMVDDPYRGMIPVLFEYAEKEELLSKMPFTSSVAHLEHLYGDGSSNENLILSYNPQWN